MRLAALLACVVMLAGCATTPPPDTVFGRTRRAVTFATWDHFAFSAKTNWQIFHYWEATASRRDAETARSQGGWWGFDVPVADE